MSTTPGALQVITCSRTGVEIQDAAIARGGVTSCNPERAIADIRIPAIARCRPLDDRPETVDGVGDMVQVNAERDS